MTTIKIKQEGLLEIVKIFVAFLLWSVLFVYAQQQLPQEWQLSKWNFIDISPQKLATVLFLYVLLIPSGYFLSQKAAKLIMVAASVLFAMILFGPYAIVIYVLAFPMFKLAGMKIRLAIKIALFIFLQEVFTALVLGSLYGNDRLFWYAFVFSIFFSLRYFLYVYFSKDSQPASFVDFLLYLYCPAYFIIQPHVVILPRFDYFTGAFLQHDKKEFLRTAQIGLRKFGLGVFLLLFCSAANFIKSSVFSKYGLEIPQYGLVFVLFDYIKTILIICGYGNLLLGLINGIGYAIKSPFNKPFLATNIIDLFDRFLIYFKEFVFSVFYAPVVVMLRKLNPYARSAYAAMAALGLSITVHEFLIMGVDFCPSFLNVIQGPLHFSERYLYELGVPAQLYGFHFKIAVSAILGIAFGAVLGVQLMINLKQRMPGDVSLVGRLLRSKWLLLPQMVVMVLVIWLMLGNNPLFAD